MSNENLLSRREFTLESALAILSAATITITGCGDDDNDSPTGPSGSNDKTGTVSANHGHEAVIAAARLTAGLAISLDIRGMATHPHTVELTAAEVTSIGSGATVSKTSTTDSGHSHTVTFN
jgi:hypothetical protein